MPHQSCIHFWNDIRSILVNFFIFTIKFVLYIAKLTSIGSLSLLWSWSFSYRCMWCLRLLCTTLWQHYLWYNQMVVVFLDRYGRRLDQGTYIGPSKVDHSQLRRPAPPPIYTKWNQFAEEVLFSVAYLTICLLLCVTYFVYDNITTQMSERLVPISTLTNVYNNNHHNIVWICHCECIWGYVCMVYRI